MTERTLATLARDHGEAWLRFCGGSELALVDFYQTHRGHDVQIARGVVYVVSVFETVLVGERLPTLAGFCVVYAASGDSYYAPSSHWAWRVIRLRAYHWCGNQRGIRWPPR